MLIEGQREKVLSILVRILRAIDHHRSEIRVDTDDLGTSFDAAVGYQPDLDDLLKRWSVDAAGEALRRGIREIGELVAPHVTMDEIVNIAEAASAESENSEWSMAIFSRMWDGLKTSDGETWSV